jgi:hypothetical protein
MEINKISPLQSKGQNFGNMKFQYERRLGKSRKIISNIWRLPSVQEEKKEKCY